jgi:3-hydroxyacyl-CoA dehydrogenase
LTGQAPIRLDAVIEQKTGRRCESGLRPDERDRILRRLRAGTDFKAELRESGAVIEAVFEDVAIKTAVLQTLPQPISLELTPNLIAPNVLELPKCY